MWVKADLDPWAGHCCSLLVRSAFLFGEERKVWVYVRGWIHLLLWTLSAVDSSWERKGKKVTLKAKLHLVRSNLTKKSNPLGQIQIHVMGGKTAIITHTAKHIYNGQTYLQHLHYRIFPLRPAGTLHIKWGQIHKTCPKHSLDPWKPSLPFSVSALCHAKEWEAYQKTSQHPALDSRPPHLYGKQRFTPWPHPPSIKIFTMAYHLSAELKRPGCFCSSSH